MSEVETDFQAPLGNPDPFVLPKSLRNRVKDCCKGSGCSDKIEYLWVHVGQHGIGRKLDDKTAGPAPSLEHWLNVVDEAASLGARWLVASIDGPIATASNAIDLCRWAQDTHEMCVAIHTSENEISADDLAALKRLDFEHTRLFVKSDAYERLKPLEELGIRVCVAEAQAVGRHGCGMPKNMLFVNSSGQLYTCGMVEGNSDFHMGSIYSRSFDKVVGDPKLPHVIPMETPYEEHGCDGCPPLLASVLKGI